MSKNENLRASINDWDLVVENYRKRWVALNRALLTEAVAMLPDVAPESSIHLSGIGTGDELSLINERYSSCLITASDLSPAMVATVRKNYPEIPVETADIHHPLASPVDITASFFVLHLVRDGVQAGLAQWESLKSGGWFSALYFPPEPCCKGPLMSLFLAARQGYPAKVSPWETLLVETLALRGAINISRTAVYSSWSFEEPNEFRKTMEILPHIASIRKRAGETFYEHMWETYLSEPGLKHEEGVWTGDVCAILLSAQHP